MNIQENFNLNSLNTFGVAASCKIYASVVNLEELHKVLESFKDEECLILGGGSNILFTKNFQGLVIHNQMTGIVIEEEDNTSVVISVSGGVVWQDLVDFTLSHNWGGIENLSLIPGTVGAAPIQNIGAYGVEIKNVLLSIDAIELSTGNERTFLNDECNFGYRNSVFKNELKDQYFITSIRLRLSKNPEINTSYGAINSVLERKGISKPTIKDVSKAVIEIRQSKLPDPTKLGNAGSFFKNPIIDAVDYEGLILEYPDMPGYKEGKNVKVPAAWLIDQCGWKGKIKGKVGVHDKQPLVLVNHGGGTGEEILNLSIEIKKSVADKYGIELEPEPRII